MSDYEPVDLTLATAPGADTIELTLSHLGQHIQKVLTILEASQLADHLKAALDVARIVSFKRRM